MIEFQLSEELVYLADKTFSIDSELTINLLSVNEIDQQLVNLIRIVSFDSLSILQPDTFDSVRSFLKHFDKLNDQQKNQLVDILLSAFREQIKLTASDLEEKAQHNYEIDKKALELYTFQLYWLFIEAESNSNQNAKKLTLAKNPKTVKSTQKVTSKKSSALDDWDWSYHRSQLIDVFHKFLLLNLNAIFISNSHLDIIINDMIFKCIRLSLESPESIKNADTKESIMDIFCHCVKNYESTVSVLVDYSDDFLREEHLAEFMADLIDSSIVNYNQTVLGERILKKVGLKLYSDKPDQDNKLPKSTAKFLLKFSELQPADVMRNIIHLNDLFDSESYTIRAVMMEVIGNIIHGHLILDDTPITAKNIATFYEILKQRFLDSNNFVRARVLKVFIKLTQRHKDSPGITDVPVKTRREVVSLTKLRLKDKNSLVRKRAVELLVALMETSPFIAIPEDMGSLSEKKFEKHVNNLTEVIKSRFPEVGLGTVPDEESLEDRESQATSLDKQMENLTFDEAVAPEEAPKEVTPEMVDLSQLQGLLLYYQDGVVFSKEINEACLLVSELLGSTLKTEIISAMKFFVTAYRFELENAEVGVKKMVHKIWDKDTGEKEAGSVRDVLINSFYDIHMDPPESGIPTGEVVADNLINLASSMDLAELISLEELMSVMATRDKLTPELSTTLWSIFSDKRSMGETEKRKYAIILLGMIGKSSKEVLHDNLDVLTRVGLSGLSKGYQIPKYSCVALQQLFTINRAKGSSVAPMARLPLDHPTCERVYKLLLEPTESLEWFSFAEQGINALYVMSEHPDKICGHVIKQLARRVFELQLPEEHVGLFENTRQDTPIDVAPQLANEAIRLAQLLFFVSHVGMKQIVHLEFIESEWKRRKNLKEKDGISKQGNDLDMVTGSVEDEFSECVAHVREHEILFSQKGLLSTFGPMIAHVCTHNQKFKHPTLQVMASIALCKFMCISSDYCEAHLQLLFTILERTKNPIIRSNIIIGLGDLTICFNSQIDQNISYLYNRLRDDDFYVKKNALMVLTFLILNGMIKVKGQISEMAKCTEDEDIRIRDLAKLFFRELSTKDNAIYNNLPDIISNLSTVEESQYRKIMRFIFSFIVKEKQNESIVEKLCLRFKHAETERQWRDVAFCLTLLTFGTEKSIKKLMEHLPLYQDKLYEKTVFKFLMDILTKITKKPELKIMIDDFKETLLKCQEKSLEDHEAEMNAKEGDQDDLKIDLMGEDLVLESEVKNDSDVEMAAEGEETSNSDSDATESEAIGIPDNVVQTPQKSKTVVEDMDEGTSEEEEDPLLSPPPKSNRRRSLLTKPMTSRRRVLHDSDED
ncbi:non-SMC mitotic condensation complex subunit 1-domain-containing protein [Globomyces pollinis-pini]|nr:non-SMC mitotic condensation complex subunit 1-domain-containing protein [Globomyces pollinis-pini]